MKFFIILIFFQLGDDANKEMEGVKPHRSVSDETELDCPGAQQQGTQLFELYLALQEFTKFRENLPARLVIALVFYLYLLNSEI
jgi:hypothetical protein